MTTWLAEASIFPHGLDYVFNQTGWPIQVSSVVHVASVCVQACVYMRICKCVCMRMCKRVCASVCVHACVHVCVCMHACWPSVCAPVGPVWACPQSLGMVARCALFHVCVLASLGALVC